MDAPPWPCFRHWKKVLVFAWLVLPFTFFLSSCGHRPPRPPGEATAHSFYYWKSVFALRPCEEQRLQQLQVDRLYVRFFDVGWDPVTHRPLPVAAIRFNDDSYRRFKIIPVVFITNETLLNLDSAAVSALAWKIGDLVHRVGEQGGIGPPRELQLDCDWTATTKDRYFQLIGGIRGWLNDHGQLGCSLSATIRLYQCKYRDRTGVPPVDRGLLMCYNMGDRKDPAAVNSILDVPLMEKYVTHLSAYPLPLDIALPVFDWKVLFRNGRYEGLVEALPASFLQGNPAVARRDGEHYVFLRDTTIDHYYFQAGDELRDEQSGYPELDKAASLIARRLGRPPATVLLYHLDSSNLSKYSSHELENLFSRFD